MAEKLTKDNVAEFVKQFADTYEKGDESFFDMFVKDANLFPLSSPVRIDSADEYRAAFKRDFIEGRERRSQVLSPTIRLLGDTAALVTFHNRIRVNGVNTNNRVSMVVELENDNLKVSHLHVSPMSAPSVSPTAALGTSSALGISRISQPAEISVLEERVATAIGAVGTPK